MAACYFPPHHCLLYAIDLFSSSHRVTCLSHCQIFSFSAFLSFYWKHYHTFSLFIIFHFSHTLPWDDRAYRLPLIGSLCPLTGSHGSSPPFLPPSSSAFSYNIHIEVGIEGGCHGAFPPLSSLRDCHTSLRCLPSFCHFRGGTGWGIFLHFLQASRPLLFLPSPPSFLFLPLFSSSSLCFC